MELSTYSIPDYIPPLTVGSSACENEAEYSDLVTANNWEILSIHKNVLIVQSDKMNILPRRS
jgi:hypothetical protein